MYKAFVVVLACLVACATADPSIRASNGDVIVKGQDLRFTHEDASFNISFTAVVSRLAAVEQSLAELATFQTELRNTTCTPGSVVVGVGTDGAVTCSDALGTQISTLSDRVGDNEVAIQGNGQAIGNAATSRGVNTQVIATEALNRAANTRMIANLTETVGSICVPRKIDTTGWLSVGNVVGQPGGSNGAGRSNLGIPSGVNRFATISVGNQRGAEIFDGITGTWGRDGAMYRAQNDIGGGVEFRFEELTAIKSWIVHCIRNDGEDYMDAVGGPCYNGGDYDFQYVKVDYWANNRWNQAGLLNRRNSGNWVSESTTGSARVSRNWRFYFSGGLGSGRCQHPNGDCAAHIAEIALYTCA
jgi:hypothetical protein